MRYLLTLSIGPVQDFIAAARRTADLQAGSQLLQQLAMHLAQHIQGKGGTLIFPASAEQPGPNKVVATIETDDPAAFAQQLREVAVQWLWQQWQSARERMPNVPLDEHLAEEQMKQFLEFYAAWVPLNGDYAQARHQAERLLAGRKALRDFRQVPCRPGRPKSPLDPSRDTVLKLDAGLRIPEQAQQEPLFLKRTEYLDAVSMLKRLKGEKGVPSTSYMAAQAILPIADQQAVTELKRIADNAPGAVDIGDLMFPTRVQEEVEEGEPRLSRYLKEHQADIDRLRRRILDSLSPRLSECPSYYAILAADGDRMGQCISAQRDMDSHRRLSAALAEVAEEMKKVVNQHNGYTVYAGGDDLLAFLPVNQVLSCVCELAAAFRKAMEPFRGGSSEAGTLSIGVAIVHRMEMLQQSLEWAREAEREAKRWRNAIAIALHTRGGVPLTAVTAFKDDPYLDGWRQWLKAFRAGLTRGFPYELQYLAREVENASLSSESLRAEAMRIFDRKTGREGSAAVKQFRPAYQQRIDTIGNTDELRAFAEQLIVARFLSEYPNGVEVRS
jgi:CRISPR-associated protein Cmr2